MLIFKELVSEVREVKGRLAILGEETDTSIDEQRLNLLMRMVSYVNSFVWLSHDSAREKVRDFLKSGYNYHEVARKNGVSVKSMHVSISYAAKRLKNRIGNGLELLIDGDMAGAEREFALGTGNCDAEVFNTLITEKFKPVRDDGVDLIACVKELSFLAVFVNRNIDSLTDTLDRKKVEHLLFILLQNDSWYMTHRSILFRCLEGQLDPAEALSMIDRNEKPTVW